MISLMSHTLKVLLKIIQQRIYRKCEEQLDEAQFGFRAGTRTGEVLFAITVLLQKCREYNKSVYVCFIDFQKAFDKVQHDKLRDLMKYQPGSKRYTINKNYLLQSNGNSAC